MIITTKNVVFLGRNFIGHTKPFFGSLNIVFTFFFHLQFCITSDRPREPVKAVTLAILQGIAFVNY